MHMGAAHLLSNPAVEIASIGPAQRDLLIEMYDRFSPLGEAFGLPPYKAEVRHAWIAKALNERVNVAAFSPDGEIIGHCFLAGFEQDRAELAIFVHQDFRRRGLATSLIKAALDRGRASGLRRVWTTTPSDHRAAVRLQLKCGFHLVKSLSLEAELEINL